MEVKVFIQVKIVSMKVLNQIGYFLVSSSFIFLCLWVSACQSNENTQSNTALSVSTEDKETADKLQNSSKKEKSVELPKLSKENAPALLAKFGEEHPETKVLLKTKLGNLTIKLYEDTPLHRANFLQLVKRNFYQGTVFHRVVKDMIIQGGNLDKPIIKQKKNAIGAYLVPAELMPTKYIHKKGALASPRHEENNPDKKSSPFEFYIVQGIPQNPSVTQALGAQNKVTYSAAQIQLYATLGGLPHLDGNYTVFGEVIEGLEVIDKIAQVKVDESDHWPLEDIFIEMEVID